MKVGDLVRPNGMHSPGPDSDPRILGLLLGKHNFFPECWNIYWNYTGRPSGMGAAYEDSLEVINESR